MAAPVAAYDRHVLVLGRISDDPAAHYEQLKPLLDYVVPRLADVGIREGRILMAQDPQQMMSYMRRGRVDWVTETSASGILLEQRVGAVPLLLTERTGVSRYRTLFVVRRDSGLRSLDELAGRSIVFQNRSSTSAYFVPAVELLERGLKLEILYSPMDEAPSDEVGYVFARSPANISTWVHKRLVDVGAMSDLDWNDPLTVPTSFRADLKVLHGTPDYPRALELVRGDLDPVLARRLREVLLQAASDPDAADALRSFFQTTAFIPIEGDAERELEYLRRAVLRVSAEIE